MFLRIRTALVTFVGFVDSRLASAERYSGGQHTGERQISTMLIAAPQLVCYSRRPMGRRMECEG
jgi:hypothetical protein